MTTPGRDDEADGATAGGDDAEEAVADPLSPGSAIVRDAEPGAPDEIPEPNEPG